MLRVIPGLNSDFEQVDREDLRLTGLFLAYYPWRPNVQVAGGLMLGDWTGLYGVMPAAGVRWQATDNLILELFMPRPRAIYKVADVCSVFASAGPAGGQWNIGDESEDDPERDLHYKAIQASVGTEWRLRPGLSVTLAGGGLFNRSLETDGAPDPELQDGRDIDDTLFVTLSAKLSSGKRPPSK
jgi:hypothetical protein